MNLVHATLIAATIFAAAQAHDGFVDSYAAASAPVTAALTTGNAGETPPSPSRTASADAQRTNNATGNGMITVSTVSPLGSPSLR